MKKLLIILLFGIFLNGLSQPFPKSGLPISHDQWYVALESTEAANGDYIAQWCVNYIDLVFNTRIGDYTYSIINGNTGDAFSINSSGMIIVNDYTELTYGSNYTLTIQTCIGGICESNYAYITVLDDAKTIFIDPPYGAGGNGNRATPYDSWADVSSKTIGYTYLQKRGTTATISATVGCTVANVNFCAYGTGITPIIAGNVSPEGFYITGDHCAMYDLYFDEATSNSDYSVLKIECDYFRSHRTTVMAGGTAEDCIYLYDGNIGSSIHDFVGYDSDAHIIKCHGTYDTIVNVYVQDPVTNAHGISLAAGSNFYLRYIWSVHNGGGNCGIEVNASDVDIAYAYIQGFYRGIGVLDDIEPVDDILISSVYVDQTLRGAGADCGLLVQDNVTDVLVKNSTFLNSTDGIYVTSNASRVDIQNCIGRSNTGSGIECASTSDYVKVYNSLFYNNTAIDVYDNTSGTHNECKNTIYKDISGTWTTATNYDYDLGDPWIDKTNNDFHLKLYTNCIEYGTDIGLTSDFENRTKYRKWPIGPLYFNEDDYLISKGKAIRNQAIIF